MNIIGTLVLILSFLVGTTLSFIRRTRKIGLIFVLVASGSITYFWWQSHHWATGFEAVALGASEREVILLVGTPQRITGGTLWVEPQFKKSNSELMPGCTKEYWYNVFYFPVAYSFCFNERSVLIQKYNWVLW
jgi:hypothetical protein